MVLSLMPDTDNVFGRWSSAELLVASHFAGHGYRIALPTAPCRYDFIVDSGFLYRVQVKTLSWRLPRHRTLGKGDRACFQTSLQIGHGVRKDVYATADFDLLVAVCDASRIYVLPTELLRCPTRAERLIRSLRIKLPLPGGRADSIRGAARWEPYLNQFVLPQPDTA